MTSVGLSTAIERAREAALTGDATSFPEHVRGIESLDRGGEAPMHELRLLAIVAAARRADLGEVDRLLAASGTLSGSEWEHVRRGLLGAPEMGLPAYIDFVRSIDRRMRARVQVPPSRRWTPMIAIAFVGMLASVALLAWRLSPVDPIDGTRESLRAVLDCDAQAVMHQLPSDWRDALRSGGESLARHDTTTAWRSTEAAIDALSAALRAASGSPHAETFAQDLLGPGARAADLARASDGVAQWRGCPWLRVGAWSSLEALQWRPAEESLLVWRAALRHMPLGVWLPGWFSPKWRCDPLRDDAIAVSRAGGQDSQTTLMILIGGQDWSAPAARVGRQWPPLALIDQWRSIEPEFATELCSAERATACQQSIADALRSIAAWIGRRANGADEPSPPVQEAPWWVR